MSAFDALVEVGGGSFLGLVAPVVAIWLILMAARAASVVVARWRR